MITTARAHWNESQGNRVSGTCRIRVDREQCQYDWGGERAGAALERLIEGWLGAVVN